MSHAGDRKAALDRIGLRMYPLTGLFLGAGASYEAGMPLVWGLTEEIKDWLTADKIRWLNREWRRQGGGHRDAYQASMLLK